MKSSQKISLPAALLILFCFFLPWISVSCGGQEIATISGMDLAAGKVVNPGLGVQPQRIGGDAVLFLVPVAAILGAIFTLAGTSSTTKQPAAGQLVAAGAGLGIMLLKWLSMNDEMTAMAGNAGQSMTGMFDVSLRFGVWGTLLGLAGLLIGGFIAFGETSSRSNDAWNTSWDDWSDYWGDDSSFY